jgi:hypothetical protein
MRGHNCQQIAKRAFGLVQAAQPLQRAAQLIARVGEIGLERNGRLECGNRVCIASLLDLRPAQRQRDLRPLWCSLARAREKLFGFGKTALAHADRTQPMQHTRIAARFQRHKRGFRGRALALPQQSQGRNDGVFVIRHLAPVARPDGSSVPPLR